MFDMADHEAQLNGLQNPMILTARVTCFDLYLASPCGRGCVPQPGWTPSHHHGVASDLIMKAASLSPSRHPPSTLITPSTFSSYLSPTCSMSSVDESLRLLPSDASLKSKNIPQRSKRTREKITKQQESNLCTSPLNTIYAPE